MALTRRIPMRRGKGFQRRMREGPTVTPPERPSMPVPRRILPLARGTYAGTTTGPAPKENPVVSAAYENAVRDLGRCMRCGRVCRPQFCHGDMGKGQGIKTDVREGWAGCGPGPWGNGCHYLVGTSGTLLKEERRAEEKQLAAKTRRAVDTAGTWPPSVPRWEEA